MRHLILTCVLASFATVAQAAWERTGQTPSGAVYRIAVPETWRAGDDLVVYQHTLSFERDLAPDLGPLLDAQLEQGYAVAASGYSQSGWAVFGSARDNRELIERFRADVGVPGRVLTYGSSMGGYVALQMAEDPAIEVAGVLALCPSAAGSRTWDAALDLRVAYDAICAGVDGGQLPQAADQPWLVGAADVSPAGLENIVVHINRCTGVNLPEWLRTDDQRQRLRRLKSTFGIGSDDFLLLNLGYATLGLSDLVRHPAKLGGAIGLGNLFVDYGDTELNATIRRVAADPFAALDFRARSSLRGDGDARIISLHTSRNELSVPEHQQALRALVPATRLSSAMVVEDAPTHCELRPAETLAAWESLRAWVDAGTQPDAVELQARCLALADTGSVAGPCRIDPDVAIDDLDAAVRPRLEPVMQLDSRFSGNWYDPDRNGEGWLVEVLDARTALIYGFTFPAAGEPGAQQWLIGTGTIIDNGIVVDEVYGMDGGAFGTAFASDQTRLVPWGTLRFTFDACGSARLRFNGPAAYGRGERRLAQLLNLGGQDCSASQADAGGPGAFSGSWYDPAEPGQGVVINTRADGVSTLAFFGYAATDGTPLWLYGQGQVDAQGRMRFDAVTRPRGTSFDRLDATAIDRSAWGAVEIDFSSCDTAVLRYRSEDPAYGEGEIALSRLTRPAGLGTCPLE
jgi:pimeloyl-ACP methyl ester carboxylesterase